MRRIRIDRDFEREADVFEMSEEWKVDEEWKAESPKNESKGE